MNKDKEKRMDSRYNKEKGTIKQQITNKTTADGKRARSKGRNR
jgi:hypothetical protein